MPYFTVGKSELYYETYGAGPAIVLAHGVGGNHASWFSQVPSFSERYQTIVIDQRSFGNSQDVEGVGRSSFVEDLAQLLDALKISKVFLVGQSMGGATCAAFTCRWPARVRGLVLADTLAGAVLPPPHDRTLEAIKVATSNLSQAERVLGPHVRSSDPERTLLYLQIASFNSVDAKTVRGKYHPWTPSELAASESPVLFVAGEHDALFPPELIRSIHQQVPGSSFSEIQGAGHSAYFEKPDAFNAVVLDFFDSLCNGGC